MPYIIWVYVTLFRYNQSFCQSTKWIPIFNATGTTVFAQIAVSLRIFAITGKNKYAGGLLALLVISEFIWGVFAMVWIGLGPLEPFPAIDLDAFEICIYKLWTLGELIYYNSAMAFDILAFAIIFVLARRPGIGRFPGIPSILDTLVRDATYYFLLIFSGHFLSVLFLFVAPPEIQLSPAMATMLLVPMMASRLMLSLKKASVEPVGMWSLEVMSSSRAGRMVGDGTVRFAPRMPDRSRETLPYSATLDEEAGMELDAKP